MGAGHRDIGSSPRWRAWALVFLSGLTACTMPGERARGRAEAAWGDPPSVRWTGSCAYEVQTRWATSLPHIVRLASDSDEWSVVLSSARRLPVGRTPLSPPGERGAQALVLEGATVRGAVQGAVQLSRRADSTFLEIEGTKVYRDTVPLQAACRLGPSSDEGSG